MKIGPHLCRDGCRFFVWAPDVPRLSLRITRPFERSVPMERLAGGYWRCFVPGLKAGGRYLFDLDGAVRPDPASNYQPEGVLGPSEIVDHSAFRWSDAGWKGFDPAQAVIYELHTGAFTTEGTFQAVIPRLPELVDLGVTALEFMPVAQFSGSRNWGYDGTYPFAVQNSYGGPEGFKTLVDACHARGLGVILDVVYNHLGPEGNFLGEFGPYFTNRCATPWGMSVNFDGPGSDPVRNYVVYNALYWFHAYHVDCLRLDAVQYIIDNGARHILAELSHAAARYSRHSGISRTLVAESDLNDSRLVSPRERGGYGIHGQWLDDFHHSMHVLLTGEDNGYYADYGAVGDLAKALERGFVYAWDYSRFRRKHYGSSSRHIPPSSFVAYNQNHDQIGNRLLGERLSGLVGFEALKLGAGVLFCAPYVPLLFMGEEYAEEAPFLYFVDHLDKQLLAAVARGRKNEFSGFTWKEEPPEPHAPATFTRSKLQWHLRREGKHAAMLAYYRFLARLRAGRPALSGNGRRALTVTVADNRRKLLAFTRGPRENPVLCCANFSDMKQSFDPGRAARAKLSRILDSAESRWAGPGGSSPATLVPGGNIELLPRNFVIYGKQDA